MNKQECDVLCALAHNPHASQHALSHLASCSQSAVAEALAKLRQAHLITADGQLSSQAHQLLDANAPQAAIILAAGFGMRMVPINLETPKALLEANGERLIERQIKQLHEVGVQRIYVVVGFMKEQFDYLTSTYGVTLIENPQYAEKNNLHSLKAALDHISAQGPFDNTYIVPCDIWAQQNPFRPHELYSWYMVTDLVDDESDVRINRDLHLIRANGRAGNQMIGIFYADKKGMLQLARHIDALAASPNHNDDFWEIALYGGKQMMPLARVLSCTSITEINTYEDLRELDSSSQHLKTEAIDVIAQQLHASKAAITDISVLKKGMTNRSFKFACNGKRYIMRIPGEGTDQLIDRNQEADVYRALSGKGLCDDPVFLDANTGYKITEFLEDVRCCNPLDIDDLTRCMTRLRAFHDMNLQVSHTFDLFGTIEYYENLREGSLSMFSDYPAVKQRVLGLQPFIEQHIERTCLTHIDAVPDNFLFFHRGNGEELQLTDWEYAGMQDPHVDIAMFSIYALYDRAQIDQLISLYFKGDCPPATRIKIYAYVAACGLLWSNWCEYKRLLGVEFGEYSLCQYRYACEYSKIVQEEIDRLSIPKEDV